MVPLKSIAQGFLAAIAIVMTINVVSLARAGDTWLAAMYLLIMLFPAASLLFLRLKVKSVTDSPDAKWRGLLFSFQGVALGFWMYDLVTTFYAINVTGLAIELNPLGWPLGILGALAFYGPMLVFLYVLLFRMQESVSFYAAIPLTLLTLGMSAMNLVAGAQNFQVFVDTAALTAGVRYELLALVIAMNFTVALALRREVFMRNSTLKLKNT